MIIILIDVILVKKINQCGIIMTNLLKNKIPGSPVSEVEIGDHSITLYGRQIESTKPAVTFHNLQELQNFCTFLTQKTGKQVITKEIEDLIKAFHPEGTTHGKVDLLYTQMKASIEEKLQKAKNSGKKLLILVGENYYSWDSFFFALLALDICKQNDINNFFVEASEDLFKIVSSENIANFWGTYKHRSHSTTLSKSAFKNGMVLHLVDPLQLAEVTYQERANKINETLEVANANAIFCVGESHLFDIMSDDKLLSKYEILTFNTSHPMLDNSLDNSPALSLTREQINNIQKEMITEFQSPQNTDDLDELADDYEFLEDIITVKNIKDMYLDNKEVTDLYINPNEKVISSCVAALNVAKNIISRYNPGSSMLAILDEMSGLYQQAQDIFYVSPSWRNKCIQMYEQLTSSQPDEENLNDEFECDLTKAELDFFSQPENNLNEIAISLDDPNIVSY